MGEFSDLVLGVGGQQTPSMPSPKPKDRISIADDILTGGLRNKSGSIDDVPLNSVITKEMMGEQKDSAGFMTNLFAGTVDNPETKIKIFSASRFPDMTPEEREQRYGIHNGEVVYLGDDGKLYRENAKTWMQGIKKFAAQTGAHLPSIIMGSLGAAGGVTGAAGGAAVGEGIRQKIGMHFFGEKQDPVENVAKIAQEGVLGAAGEVVGGAVVNKGLNYLGAKRGGLLAAKAGPGRQRISIPEAQRLKQQGMDWGINLSPAEYTKSRELINRFNFLGDLSPTADTIKAARVSRVGEIESAVTTKLPGKLSSSNKGGLKISDNLVDAAQKAVEKPVIVRRGQAGPIYRKAFDEAPAIDTIGIRQDLANVFDDPLPASAEAIALSRLNKMLPEEATTLRNIDKFKKEIDKLLGDPTKNPKYAIDKAVKRKLIDFKNKMLEQVDEISPDYKRARAIFAEYSEEVERQSVKTLAGKVASLKGDDKVTAMSAILDSRRSTPDNISKARNAIRPQDPESWDAAVRNYVMDEFMKINQRLATDDIANIGGNFAKRLFGTPSRVSKLKAAMTAEQFGAVKSLMEVLEATGPIMRRESMTAARQAMADEMGDVADKVIRSVTMPLYTKKRILGDFFRSKNRERNLQRLANAMVSEDAAAQLAKMRQLTNNQEKLIPQITTFLTLVASGHFEDAPRDRMPGGLKGAGRQRAGLRQ